MKPEQEQDVILFYFYFLVKKELWVNKKSWRLKEKN